MTQFQFLECFPYDMFPKEKGPWVSEESIDPPFKDSELKKMEKAELIERESGRFRLTLKATKKLEETK